jgi:LysM repeat protein
MGNLYLKGIYAAGNGLSDLYDLLGSSSTPRTTLYSSTAGTTPMALLPTQSQSKVLQLPGFNVNGGSTFNQAASARAVGAARVADSAGVTAAPSARSSGGAELATTSSSGSYTVRPGDTLGNIAYANHTTLSAIQAANPAIQNVNYIQAGWQINVPGHR